MNRRKFLGQASCAAVGSTTFLSTLVNLCTANTAAASIGAAQGDYKAMVCVLMAGGIDSFNMLIPSGNPEYGEYSGIRTNLAIPQNEILPINPIMNDGKQYGVHPGLSEVQTLFENGDLAFMSNVGAIIEPVNKAQYNNGSVKLPLGLYSHADQIKHWQTSIPQSRNSIGWGGRMADIIHEMNSNQNISMNISLSGSNVFQTGNNIVSYSISPNGSGSQGMINYSDEWTWTTLRKNATDSLLNQEYKNLYESTFINSVKNAQAAHEQFSGAIDASHTFSTVFPDSGFSDRLHMIARTISSQNLLSMNRQIFFLIYGGWDHHDGLITLQNNMLPVLSQGIGAFNTAMKEIGMDDKVTLFTISDFARTLTSNGNGSDHAWGGPQMAVGGAVNGKSMYGAYPDLYDDNPQDVGRGRLIPTLSADEYFAELALWFGVPKSDLDKVLPNISNFYSLVSDDLPIGFMNI
jgi:uncharacterized protein (DUF1501 family)